MIFYFIAISFAALILIGYLLRESDVSWDIITAPFFVLVIWFFVGFFPCVVHTSETQVSTTENFHVFKLTKYKTVVLPEDQDEVLPVTDAYLIDKIQAGEFKVEKHEHRNIFGFESISPTYYVVPTHKK